MELNNRYIPREYLALKINYCKKQLAELPEVKLYNRRTGGSLDKTIILNNHRYAVTSPIGTKLYKIFFLRDEIQRELKVYEALWDCYFKGIPLPECMPRKIKRILAVDYNKRVIMDKAFFDSLKEDANTKHQKSSNNSFNGINYRSAAEREIAIFYTEMGIPFKYEPEITLIGVPYTINPDFVLYIKELDTCKFHEHLGIKRSADYIRDTKIKYGNYTSAGLIPDIDILFTHDTDEVPFDIRYLIVKLNACFYGSLLSNNGTDHN